MMVFRLAWHKTKRNMEKIIRKQYSRELRLLGIDQLCAYTGMGINQAAEFGKKAKAEVRFGKHVLYDRLVIDQAIEAKRMACIGG